MRLLLSSSLLLISHASTVCWADLPCRHVGTESRAVAGETDCAGGEVHDDGTAEGGLTWSGGVVGTYVERLTPATLPFRYESVCLCWFQQNPEGDTSLDFDLVVYDDDGPGGQPGTLLATLPANAAAVPPELPGDFYRYDISGLGIELNSGSVYVGARWDSNTEVDFLLCTDESSTTPQNTPFGSFDQGANWFSVADVFPVRTFLVRAEGVGLPPLGPPDVPALSPRALFFLSLLLAAAGVVWMRRR